MPGPLLRSVALASILLCARCTTSGLDELSNGSHRSVSGSNTGGSAGAADDTAGSSGTTGSIGASGAGGDVSSGGAGGGGGSPTIGPGPDAGVGGAPVGTLDASFDAAPPDGSADASDAGVKSMGDGTAVGTLGKSCSPNGAYACAGHAQKGQLICNHGTWQPNGNCSGNDNCDTTPGASAGSCQPTVAGCENQSADTVFCSGNDRLKCGADLITTTRVDTCQYVCQAGVCTGECVPKTRQCNGLVPQSCDATGAWQNGSTCTNVCSGGACSGTCSPKAKQCNGLVVQTCDANGTWQDGASCTNQACIMGACSGVCMPGSKRCSNDGVETCDATGQWGTAAPCTNQACVNGACAGTCVPTATQCSGNAVQTCSSTGTWNTAVPCTPNTQTCSAGACVTCAPGTLDCDGSPANACEKTINLDTSCGKTCATASCTNTQTCAAGACTACAAGTSDCDGSAQNGCETNTNTSLTDCGACGNSCGGTCVEGLCFGYTPTNFDPHGLDPMSTSGTTQLNCGVSTFDSTTMTFGNWCGQNVPKPTSQGQASGGPNTVILPLRNLTIASGSTLRLTGASPVILVAFGDASIAGTIDASASSTTPGAGGNLSCGTSQGGNGSGDTARNDGASGGGGGGFGTAGGGGGDANTDRCCGGSNVSPPGGAAGSTRGGTGQSPLLGGCAGGMAGGCATAGGAGGGAVQLSASGTVTVTGTVKANGGDGATPCGANDEGGGTGGGSGGGILLEAKTLMTTGATLQANGGAGGPDGSYFHCSSGSAGSASSSSAGSPGQSCVGGAPGGGGGYGRIKTLTH